MSQDVNGMLEHADSATAGDRPSNQRRSYRTPRLTVHGPVEVVTRTIDPKLS